MYGKLSRHVSGWLSPGQRSFEPHVYDVGHIELITVLRRCRESLYKGHCSSSFLGRLFCSFGYSSEDNLTELIRSLFRIQRALEKNAGEAGVFNASNNELPDSRRGDVRAYGTLCSSFFDNSHEETGIPLDRLYAALLK